MKHVGAILLKTVIISVVYVMIHFQQGTPLYGLLALSIFTAVFTYIFGDLMILPMTSNAVAALVDGATVVLLLWFLSPYMIESTVLFHSALFSGALIGTGEWLFHSYYRAHMMPRKEPL